MRNHKKAEAVTETVPLLSIFMITYNHGKYIRQALDSILMQRVNFDYEVIVGEDCSHDDTRQIVIEYAEKYPDRIKPILQKHNKGPNENAKDVFRRCRGKYIAFLEGDDYWIDSDKLQIQIDYMESHSEKIIFARYLKDIRYLKNKDKASTGGNPRINFALLNAINIEITRDMIRNDDKVIIYGTKDWGRKICHVLFMKHMKILAFLDSNQEMWSIIVSSAYVAIRESLQKIGIDERKIISFDFM